MNGDTTSENNGTSSNNKPVSNSNTTNASSSSSSVSKTQSMSPTLEAVSSSVPEDAAKENGTGPALNGKAEASDSEPVVSEEKKNGHVDTPDEPKEVGDAKKTENGDPQEDPKGRASEQQQVHTHAHMMNGKMGEDLNNGHSGDLTLDENANTLTVDKNKCDKDVGETDKSVVSSNSDEMGLTGGDGLELSMERPQRSSTALKNGSLGEKSDRDKNASTSGKTHMLMDDAICQPNSHCMHVIILEGFRYYLGIFFNGN